MALETARLPIIRLWNRVLVTLQGEITDDAAAQLTRDVLGVLHTHGADGLVLDVTGVWLMDSHLCSVISSLSNSARLMGAPTVITGMSPDIALTLQTMGVEFSDVRTALSVEQALTMLGLVVQVRDGRGPVRRRAARRETSS
jgi:rsbT antagonist protein RsbS